MYLKIIFTIIGIFLIPYSMFAQNRIEKIQENIEEVSISNGLSVEIETDVSESKIEIKGKDRADLKIKIKNGKLKLMLQDQPVFRYCHDVCLDRDKNLY
ncbi:MAG: hypothetical protein ABR595_05255, partial [Psychroflexus sp.]